VTDSFSPFLPEKLIARFDVLPTSFTLVVSLSHPDFASPTPRPSGPIASRYDRWEKRRRLKCRTRNLRNSFERRSKRQPEDCEYLAWSRERTNTLMIAHGRAGYNHEKNGKSGRSPWKHERTLSLEPKRVC
jgi:hypothetical protein